MYINLRRHHPPRRRADAGGHGLEAEAHRGTPRDFLSRHEAEAKEAAAGPRAAREGFAACLFGRVADERNLKLALDHLAGEGGDGPGPDGLRPSDLGPSDRWGLARALRDAIHDGTYRPGPHRVAKIPKGGGAGRRSLAIRDVQDRAVERAILQVLQPLLDPRLLESSFGSRPGKGREHALARADALAHEHRLPTFVAADLKDAFGNVPLKRLADILKRRLPAADLLGLIDIVVADKKHKGLRQGGALSPLLLNLYLDHVLDRPWRKAHPGMPLIRYVDDILILCKSPARAAEARAALGAMTTSAGMPLNPKKDVACDFQAGQTIEWLGFGLRWSERGLMPHLTERAWEQLDEALARVHEVPNSPLRAGEVIKGWLDQAGPCSPQNSYVEVKRRIVEVAGRHAIEEIPRRDELESAWNAGSLRYTKILHDAKIGARLVG